MQDGGRSVGLGEFVVACGQSAPLLQGVEAALDDVAAFVRFLVVGDGPPADGSLALAVGFLVFLLRDHALDAVGAQVGPDPFGGVGLVGHGTVRAGSRPPGTFPLDSQRFHEVFKHGRVPALAGAKQQHQRAFVAVDQGVDLGGQSAAGLADGMVGGFIQQVFVIRQVPLCGGAGSCRAGGHG